MRAPWSFLACSLLAPLLHEPAVAGAALLRGPYDNPHPVALELQLGLQGRLAPFTPGGFNVALDYTHRFSRPRQGQFGLWFFGNVGFVVNSGHGACPQINADFSDCSTLGYGSGLNLKAGVQMTFRTAIPLVPYVRAGAAINGAFGRDCNDSGGGFSGVAGGGARYFLTQHLGVGLHTDLQFGPMFYGAGQCYTFSRAAVYASMSLLGSVQYAL